jgi:hypothetical protein
MERNPTYKYRSLGGLGTYVAAQMPLLLHWVTFNYYFTSIQCECGEQPQLFCNVLGSRVQQEMRSME